MTSPISRFPHPRPPSRRHGARDARPGDRIFRGANEVSTPPPLACLFGMAKAGAESLYRRRLREHGLTPTQWMILTSLWRSEGLSVGELVRCHGTKAPALSRALSRMERIGLVERQRELADRRVVRIYLTPKARDLSYLQLLRAEVNEQLLAGLNTEERETFVQLLHRVIANVRRKAPKRAEQSCRNRDLL